jgi:hypothetical protein
MPDYFCTFRQSDPVRKHNYTVISAATVEAAHDIMNALYGQNWSRVYESAEAAGIDRWDLTFINPGT